MRRGFIYASGIQICYAQVEKRERGKMKAEANAIAVLPVTMTKENGDLNEGNLVEPYPGARQRAHGLQT